MAIDAYSTISKNIMKWQWYTDIPAKVLFMHLILKANFTSGRFKDIVVERGQTVTSYRHLADETGLTVQQVRTAINKLLSTQEITQDTTSTYQVITLNNYEAYNYDKGKANTPSNTSSNNQITNEQQTDNKPITTIEEGKEREEGKDKYSDDSREMELCKLLYTMMKANNDKVKEPNIQSWCNDISRINKIDGHSLDDIEELIRWTQQDEFWKKNILSPSKLRKQFVQLWGKRTPVKKSHAENLKILDELDKHF